MGLYTGTGGSYSWTLVLGRLDDNDSDRFVQHLLHLTRTVTPGHAVLDMLYDMPMPTPVQRRRIVEVLENAPRMKHVAGHALVVNNSIGRGVLTAVNWIVRPPFEEEIFSRPDDAATWLEARCPSLDTKTVMRDVADAYPGFPDLRW